MISENAVLGHVAHFWTYEAMLDEYADSLKELEAPEGGHVISIVPEMDKYDEHTWERSIHVHACQATQRLGHWLLMWAQVSHTP